MALKTNIIIEETGLQLENAYIALREFIWKGGVHADVGLDIWASYEAYTSGKIPIKRLRYSIPVPFENPEDIITETYNQVRTVVYNWVKENALLETQDV